MINNRQAGRRRGRGGQRPPNAGGRPDGGSRIDNRARGNASQLLEKYRNLASDAQRQGDRVNTEYYLQFADHYFRVLNENRPPEQQQQRRWRDDADEDDGFDERGEDLRADGDGDRAERGNRDVRESRDEREPREARGHREDREQREPRDQREPREAGRQRFEGEGGQRRTYRQEREARDRQDAEPAAEGVTARAPQEAVAAESAPAIEAERPRRRRREAPVVADAPETGAGDLPARLFADQLPPAIAPSGEGTGETSDEEPVAPRRRTRRPRAQAEDGEGTNAAA